MPYVQDLLAIFLTEFCVTDTKTTHLMGQNTLYFFLTFLNNEYNLLFKVTTLWETGTFHTLWKGQSYPKNGQ